MIIILRKLEFYQKIVEPRIVKILITIPLTLDTMQQLIIKHWRRDPDAEKKLEVKKL